MKKSIILTIIFTLVIVVTAENEIERKKKGHYSLNGIFFKSGLMSIITFLIIKAKIIIAIAVAFAIFVFGAKVWATLKYGNMLFHKGCHDHEHEHSGLIFPHPHPTSYGHEFASGAPVEFEAVKPGYAYEKFSRH